MIVGGEVENVWEFSMVWTSHFFPHHLYNMVDPIRALVPKMLSLGNVNLFKTKIAYTRWFSRRDLALSPNVGGHQQPFQKGHVFTHHPKKVTRRIARQVFFWDDYDSNPGFKVDNYQDVPGTLNNQF